VADAADRVCGASIVARMMRASWVRSRVGRPAPAAIIGWLVFGLTACSGGSRVSDADLAFCTAPSELGRLADVAMALGVAGPGPGPGQLTAAGAAVAVADWPARQHADFSRACQALVAADRPPRLGSAGSSGAGPLLTVLLPLLIGALLTLFTTEWRDVRGDGRRRADALRAAADAFGAATRRYLRGWQDGDGRPDEEPVRATRLELSARLREVATMHPSWSWPRYLRRTVLAGVLGDGMGKDWVGRDRIARVAELEAALDDLLVRVDAVAGALARPGWPRRAMRRRVPAGAAT
jgi:hypothetical protein